MKDSVIRSSVLRPGLLGMNVFVAADLGISFAVFSLSYWFGGVEIILWQLVSGCISRCIIIVDQF